MAKRVNTRFLIILTAVIGVMIAAVVTIQVVGVFRKDPAAQEADGDKLLNEGKPKEALEKYKYAVAGNPTKKDLLVKVGDAYNQMTAEDPQGLHHARAVWNQIVANDPRYELALERLLESYWQQMESSALEGELHHRVRETAQRLSDVRPADLAVAAKVHIVTLRPWLDGMSQVFKSEEVRQSREALQKLMSRDRGNAEIPYYVALANLKEAQDLRRSGHPDDEARADALTQQAGRVMDAAVTDQPENGAMQLRAYQVYSTLDQITRARAAADRRKAVQAGRTPPPAEEGDTPHGAKSRAALAAALEASKKIDEADPIYADIQMEAAEFARRDRRPDDAEKIYDGLVKTLPNDQNIRIRYAQLLTQSGVPAKREEAIKQLSADVNLSHLKGARGYIAAQLRARRLADLVDVRIEQARDPKLDDKSRQAIIAQANAEVEKLTGLLSSDSVPVLRLKGRLQQLAGDPIGSIQTFERAVSLMQGSTNKDFNLVNDLAQAYLFAGQTGSAKGLLQEVIDRHEWFVPARLQMAQVLIAENKLNDAKMHLDQAEKQLASMQGQADLKELPAWQAYYQRTALSLLSKARDPRLDEQFAQMAEGNRQERLTKATIAQVLKKYDEAVRLGSAQLAENPTDLQALDVVTNGHLAAGRKAEALAAVDKVIAAGGVSPEAAQRLKTARERILAEIELADATPEEIYARNKKLIEQEPESPDRAVKLASLEMRYRHFDAAESVLNKALASDPSNVAVLGKLYDLALRQEQWQKAQELCDKLVATKGDGADGLLYKFRLATARGDKDQAVRLGKQVVDARPEFDLGYVAYGQALQAADRHAEAVQQYKQARARKPLNFDALRGMVECFYAMSQPDDAKRLIEEARELFPENAHFKDLALRHELQYGDPQTVVAEREEIHRRQPEEKDNWLQLAGAYRTVARSKFEREPAKKAEVLAKARDLLQKGLQRWKEDHELTMALSAVLADAGEFEAGEKLLADYAAAPERAAQAEPLLALADYYVRANRMEKAEQASREGLKRAEAARDEALQRVAAAGADEDAADEARAAAAAHAKTAVNVRVRLAEFLSRFQRHDEALAELDAAKPGDGPGAAELSKAVFRQRLQVLIASGRRDVAERLLLEALANPAMASDTDLQMTLVAVNFDGGKYDEALERVNQLLKADPDNVKVRFFRGQILMKKPRPDLARAHDELLEVRKRDPNSIGARVLLAEVFRKQGNKNQAIRELQEGLRLQPTSRDLRLRLMDYWSDPSGPDWGEVRRLAREAREHLQLRDDPVWAHREAGVHVQRRDWPNAIAAIEDAMKLDPRDANLVREHQSILLLAGRHAEVLKRTEGVAEGKAPWWVYLNRGTARHALKDTPGAVAEFNTGLSAAGENSAAVEQIVKTMVATVGKQEALSQVLARSDKDPRWKLLAAALYSVNTPEQGGAPGEPPNWDKAVQMLDEVQAHFNDLSPAHKAQALRIAGPLYQTARPPQFDKAKKSYEQLLQLQPNDLFALNNLANLLVDDALVPQPQEARQYSQKAYDLVKRAQPFPAAIFDTHGWVLLHCGEVTEAIDILQKVVRQTKMPEAHYHLGEAYIRNRDYRRAQEELRLAAQTIPEVVGDGAMVSPDLEKKIQTALQKAAELERAARGGEADAR